MGQRTATATMEFLDGKEMWYFQDDETGDFTAVCKEVPQAVAQGRTKEESKTLLLELIKKIENNETIR